MSDFNPLALRRMWTLRQFPMFATTQLGDLALLAENVTDVVHPTGITVAHRGRPAAIELVVDGEIASGGERWRARQAFGLVEVLGSRELACAAIATCPTHTLRLAAEDVGDVLEEGFGIMRAVIGELAGRSRWPVAIVTPGDDAGLAPLDLIERLIVLRRFPPFASASVDALAALAHVAYEMVTPPGVTLASVGERATRAHVVLEGSLRVTGAGRSRLATAGSICGGIEVLGELTHRYTLTTATRARTLTFDAQPALDVIEEHPELGLAVLSALAANIA